MPTRIVTYVHRPGRASQRKKARPAAITGPAIVTKRTVKTRAEPTATAAPSPANDDRKPALKETAVVTVTGQKQMKLRRAEREAEGDDDPEATARVKAFLARMIRPGGALPPGVDE